jgi:protein SCO1
MKLRSASRLSVLAAIAVIVVIVLARDGMSRLFTGGTATANAALVGTSLGGIVAPGFTLRDQDGAQISLSGFLGQPIVLSFLYTHCQSTCALTAEQMRAAAQDLGAGADRVAWVAISVDPAGDTAESAKAFAETHGLTGRLHFLMGPRTALAPIWCAYHLASPNDNCSIGGPENAPSHLTGVILIDKHGKQQVLQSGTVDPRALAGNLNILLGER